MTRRVPKQAAPVRPSEQALLQAIVNNPDDAALWLILADWLEENDDPRRAELLRLHRQMIATCCEPEKHPERVGQQARMVRLLAEGVRPSVPRQTLTLKKGVDMTFVWIPPGSFLMGSPPREKKRRKAESRHRVRLTKGFWLGETPVTKAAWGAVLDRLLGIEVPDHPIHSADWDDCQTFCRRLGEQTGKAARLPTEAEWEYACRAGTTSPFFFGEAMSTEQANYDGRVPYGREGEGAFRMQTTPVGSFPPNAWGLYDMHGNVMEWCQDWFDKAYYTVSPEADPQGPAEGGDRVVRGGSFGFEPWFCRSAFRLRVAPVERNYHIGCRVVLGAG